MPYPGIVERFIDLVTRPLVRDDIDFDRLGDLIPYFMKRHNLSSDMG